LTGIFAVLDDISVLMQDTAVMAKVATKKTVGVLGDDLAISAEQASKFHASREIPVLIEIIKGSFKNKLYILPIALLLSYYLPFIIAPILFAGGIYLAFEGTEKIYEYFKHYNISNNIKNNNINLLDENKNNNFIGYSLEYELKEKEKINKAIKTDFVLSIEIIIIALSSVSDSNIFIKIVVVSFIAFLTTIGVYGTVAFLVRLDDFGLKLIEISDNFVGKSKKIIKKFGIFLVSVLPYIIKFLTVVGTIAMLVVAGHIFLHTFHIDEIDSIIFDFVSGISGGSISFSLFLIYEKFLMKTSK